MAKRGGVDHVYDPRSEYFVHCTISFVQGTCEVFSLKRPSACSSGASLYAVRCMYVDCTLYPYSTTYIFPHKNSCFFFFFFFPAISCPVSHFRSSSTRSLQECSRILPAFPIRSCAAFSVLGSLLCKVLSLGMSEYARPIAQPSCVAICIHCRLYFVPATAPTCCDLLRLLRSSILGAA